MTRFLAPLTGWFLCAVVLCSASLSHAQQWATKMLNKTDHDFGLVARGSDTVYKFEVKNIYKEDIVLDSVRSSCGCTSPSIEGNVLKTYEKGYIVAKFNTRTFTGIHSATLTVTISKPYPAQIQLRVHGNIRGDVVFEPGMIDFGTVKQGEAQQKSVNVAYAGRSDWRIDDVRSESKALAVELIERGRVGGKVNYELAVKLRDDAPAGFLKEQLFLVTGDQNAQRISLDVAGRVLPEVSVQPENLVLGEVSYNQPVTKRLMVKATRPFKVLSVECGDKCFAFKHDDTEKARHIVTVTFDGQRDLGAFKAPILIKTSLGETFTATCNCYATVVKAPTEPATADGSSTEAGEDKTAQLP